jgi:AcrR family transcriptional regulator
VPAKPQYTSVWARRAAEESRPEKKDAPSQAQIVRAAIEILDAEGLDALSMRRLGTKLGMGATSIYWYVANKTELLDLALDEVIGEIAMPSGLRLDWLEAASVFAHSMHQTLLRHPWAITLFGSRPALGPHAVTLAEKSVVLFEEAGFRGPDISHATSALLAYIIGACATEARWLETVAGTDLTPEQWVAQTTPTVATAIDGHPRLQALQDQICGWDLRDSLAERFEFGLRCILDGFATRLP